MNGDTSTPLYISRKKKRRKDKHAEAGPGKGKPVSEKWRPVWLWLESLQRTEVVEPSEVIAWLDSNPGHAAKIRGQHSNGGSVAYVQKCHQRLIFGQYNINDSKKNRVSKPMRPPRLTDDPESSSGQIGSKAIVQSSQNVHQDRYQLQLNHQPAHNVATITEYGEDERSVLDPETWRECWRKKLNVTNSETQVNAQGQRHSASPYPTRIKRQREFYTPDDPDKRVQTQKQSIVEPIVEPNVESLDKMDTLTKFELILELEMRLKEIGAISKASNDGRKRRLGSDATQAWACSEGTTDNQNSTPSVGVVESLIAREQGANSRSCAYTPREVGKHGKNWNTMLNGWSSLEKQRFGPINSIQKRVYSTWKPTWCAYTSSNDIANALGGTRMDQTVQKILDVRFHPGGEPLLAVSCNEPPNELLLYDLKTGRGKPLTGHNTQIQVVEFAANGTSVVSCAHNIVKVWDTSSGACSRTLGPGLEDGTPGHIKKISALTVNQFQPYLVATAGGEGDSRILLWNIQSGQMTSDLNANYRQRVSNLLSMDALKFARDTLLICGSDAPGDQPAIVQIWDIDACVNVSSYPAHDTYMTCLEVNNSGSTIITGSGDGSIGLFDIRTSGAIARLPLSSSCEVTSVSFSSCETYFQASCTANCTFVWDTRMMPFEIGQRCIERPPAVTKGRAFRALHQLSHGKPMPTVENSFQVPGTVDVGDQGVNDAKWFKGEAILVTASGSGSVTMWDPTLGQPCVQHFKSHKRCVNTVAVSPTDQFICTGGDDQKVVLYQNIQDQGMSSKWRLTYPLERDSHEEER